MTDNRVLSSLANSTAAGKNAIINGGFDIWQRGTTVTPTNWYGYTADRWISYSYGTSTGTASRQNLTPGEISGYNGQYFLRSISTNTSTYLSHKIEDVRTFAGQVVTISFWGKSSVAQNSVYIQGAQKFGSGGSADVVFSMGYYNFTTSWQKFSYTTTMPSISGKTIGSDSYFWLEIFFGNININFDVTGFQLELGPTATPFSRAAGTIQQELAACQRYYIRWKSEDGSANNPTMPIGQMINTTTFRSVLQFPTAMRIKPSAIEYSGFRLLSGSSGYTVTNIVLSQGSALQQELQATITSGPAAATAAQLIPGSGSTTDYIGLSAEL